MLFPQRMGSDFLEPCSQLRTSQLSASWHFIWIVPIVKIGASARVKFLRVLPYVSVLGAKDLAC